jgi:hypothetical protein
MWFLADDHALTVSKAAVSNRRWPAEPRSSPPSGASFPGRGTASRRRRRPGALVLALMGPGPIGGGSAEVIAALFAFVMAL